VFVKLQNSDGNFLSDIGWHSSSGQILYNLDSGSTGNIIIAATLTSARGLYGTNGVINNGGTTNVIIKPGG